MARSAEKAFVLGYDLGSVGTWLRLAFGVMLSGYLLVRELEEDVTDLGVLAAVTGWFLAITVAYLVAFWLLGPRVLARRSPWVGTIILYGPVLLLAYLDVADTVALAAGLYIAISTLVVVFIRYGGCEVIGIPSLLLRRRYVVYCPWNLHSDLSDKLLADSRFTAHARGRGPELAAASAIAAVTLAFSDLGPLPELRWEPRLLLAAAAGATTILLWAALRATWRGSATPNRTPHPAPAGTSLDHASVRSRGRAAPADRQGG